MRLFILLFLLSLGMVTFSQIFINEFQSANDSIFADEDGDFEDWIEIYNAGISPVNLQNYGLSDKADEPFQWTFPSKIIEPDERLLIFASGKNRKPLVNHWEMAVNAPFVWKYFVGTSEPPENWTADNFNAAQWQQGNGGIGYGDDDDNTVISPTISLYMRHVFPIPDTSKIRQCIFCMDYDDGFVAYFNGIEIARSNVSGTPPSFNTIADADHEAQIYQGGQPEYFAVPLDLIKGAMHVGNNVLAVQTHNISSSSSDLSAIPFLFFGIGDNSFTFNEPPEWFDATGNSNLHTNFKLDVSGEAIILTKPNGTAADSKIFGYIAADNSLARIPDGSSNWCFSVNPSPNAANNGIVCYDGYTPEPTFTLASGFYRGTKTVEIKSDLPGTVIHFTTNGNIPKQTDPIYLNPLTISNTQVLRARSFGPSSYLPGNTATNTYVFNDSFTVPVVSISTDSSNLWDYYTGIYVMGPNASPDFPHFGANFWNDWERESHIEYFTPSGINEFELDGFISIHGGWTRGLPQKSLTIETSSSLANSAIPFQLFADKPITEFKNMVVRNSGNDWMVTHFRDALMQTALKDAHTDYMAYAPSVVLLNGEYWGVYNIRERHNQEFIEENHGVDADSIDMIKFDYEVAAGNADAYFEMVNFIQNHDLSIQENFEVVKQMWDIENYADYFIAETYYVNNDWIGAWTNNVELWRERKTGAKWRYILWDMDFGLGLASSPSDDKLGDAMNPSVPSIHSEIFVKMLQNNGFRNYFINRYGDLINTTFKPADLKALAYQMRDSIENEMSRAWMRWFGNPNIDDWYNNIENMVSFINQRPMYARNHIQSHFSLSGFSTEYLTISPPGAGRIKINTVIPDSDSWSGIYFRGVPITITAIANPGYTFENWSPNTFMPFGSTSRTFTFDPTSTAVFKANFTGSPESPKITISEINYHSDSTRNAGDWFELSNYGAAPLDISDWHLQDSEFYNDFIIPTETVIPPFGFVVISEDPQLFHTQFPEILTIGPCGFKLGNSGETIKIFDYQKNPVLNFSYTDSLPWPECADGWGRTLELILPNADINNPENWRCGCMGGSPGQSPSACSESIIISEINYNSADWADAGDWIEIYNVSDEPVNVNGWKFSDSDNLHQFVILNGITVQDHEYLVLCGNLSKFESIFPDITNKTGPFNFGLSGEGEAIRLFDADGRLYFSMVYDDHDLWPTDPDGDGFTLELADENGDFNSDLNWFAGCPGGSPSEAYFEPCNTGIPETENAGIIFPNPANKLININLTSMANENFTIKIIDGFGVLFFTQTFESKNNKTPVIIDVERWKSGIYLTQILDKTGNLQATGRFIILR